MNVLVVHYAQNKHHFIVDSDFTDDAQIAVFGYFLVKSSKTLANIW